MALDISSIIQDLRESKTRVRRDSPDEPYLKPGGRAWRRRERKKKELIDKELDRLHARAKAQARYHRKNKETLNRKRIIRARRPTEVYARAVRKAKRRDQAWEFTFDEWWRMWSAAPDVMDEARGLKVSAWKMKGSNPKTCTQMARIDLEGPWSKDNCVIQMGGKELSGNSNGDGK